MYEGLINDLLDAAKVDKGTSTSKLLERAAEAIERLEERVAIMSAEPDMRWISVKDKLPEESGNVLVCVKLNYANGARYVQMCHYSAYKKQFGCFDTLESNDFPKFGVVTHWMPLPEILKEGET